MAIAFDTATNIGTANPGTSVSGSHTSTGSNLIGFVGVLGGVIGTDADDVNAPTWGATTMTLVDKITGAVASARYVYLFVIQGQASGAQTIAVTCGASHYMEVLSASYTGCSQTGQVDNHTKIQDANVSTAVSLTTVADNCWAMLVDRAIAPVASTGATLRVTATFSDFILCDTNALVHPAGSVSMTVTNGNSAVGNNVIMASFKPPSAGGPLFLNHGDLNGMGVGGPFFKNPIG